MLWSFPPALHHYAWHRKFDPCILAWAGAQEDVYGIDSEEHVSPEITSIWELLYPSNILEDVDFVAIVRLVQNTLNKWRFHLGIAGYLAVQELFLLNPELTFKERQVYISDALKDLRFIYKHPDSETSREAFCSALVAKVYSTHLKAIGTEGDVYGRQIGGLALAAAAVERGLLLSQIENTTHFLNQEAKWTTHEMRRRLDIAENYQTDRVEHFMKLARELHGYQWADIVAESSVYLVERSGNGL